MSRLAPDLPTRLARLVLAFALLPLWVGGPAARAQAPGDEPAWQEAVVSAPPSFDAGRAVPLEVSRASSLAFAVDPQTVTVGTDGVVRYVLIASSPGGALNVFYEGVRCATGAYRLYARHSREGGWAPVADSAWTPLGERGAPRHALVFARTVACDGRATAGSAREIVQALRYPRVIAN